MKKASIVPLFLFLFFAQLAQAQSWSVGVLAGGTAYIGDIDINLKTVAPQMRLALGIYGRLSLTEYIVLRGQVSGARLFADEMKYPTKPVWEKRGFNFKSQIIEMNVVAEWRPFPGTVQPYIYGGIGGVLFDSKTFYNEPNSIIPSEEIAQSKNDGVNASILPVVPIGGGLEFFLGDNFSIGLDFGVRLCTQDYLDGLSKLSGSRAKDFYVISGLTFAKVFGTSHSGNRRMSNRNVGCPTF